MTVHLEVYDLEQGGGLDIFAHLLAKVTGAFQR